MKQIGAKIYYCTLTGNVLQFIGDMQGSVIETSFDEDYKIYPNLYERDKKSVGLLKFEFGEYPKLSQGSTGVKVNLETKELEFTYEELQPILQESTEIEIIQKKISILEAENKSLRKGLQAVLSGDMQSLAYILYPEDFTNVNKSNTTLEL